MEDVMLKYYMANADKAGVGLECLPGVKQLLQELKVCSFCDILVILLAQVKSQLVAKFKYAMHCHNPFVKGAMGSYSRSTAVQSFKS